MKNYKGILLLVIILVLSLFASTFIFAEETCLDQNTGDNLCEIDPTTGSILTGDGDSLLILENPNNSEVTSKDYICGVYITGIGCPHCAKIDPVLLKDTVDSNPNLVIIEYEVKQKRENTIFALDFDEVYDSGTSIPFLIYDTDNVFYYSEIEDEFINNLNNLKTNNCPLPSSIYSSTPTIFSNLNLNEIQGKFVIWKQGKALERISSSKNISNQTLHSLLDLENIDSILEDLNFTNINENYLPLSGAIKSFDQAIEFDGWRFYFNGECTVKQECNEVVETTNPTDSKVNKEKLSLFKVITLALTDAVNPCAFAVLLMLLLTITTYTSNNKRKILKAGFLFILSIFIMYFLYGLIFISLFKSFSGATSIVAYKIFAVVALILGILQIKDFFDYRPGSIGTEMPMGLRPKVQKLIKKATSPIGAFIVGLFVTVFLLPCTIGPYIVATNSLALIDILKSIPMLLLYNLIFIIPMIAITLIVYFGVSKIQDIGAWKQRNIRYFHLIAGAIIFILGLLMLFGFI